MSNKIIINDVGKITVDKKTGKSNVSIDNRKLESSINKDMEKLILKHFPNAKKS